MRDFRCRFLELTCLVLFLSAAFPAAISAQQLSEFCIGQGHKPGSANYYRCLQAHQSAKPQGLGDLSKEPKGKADEAKGLLTGTPENALGDFSGATTEGATSPDPDLLKQLDQGDLSPVEGTR